VCSLLGDFTPEPQQFVGFQDYLYEHSDLSFQSNEASVLDHIVPTTFSINSLELELHDRKVCFVHLCYGLTRMDLSFLENLRSIG
jgi:hypothetical protein